MKTFLKFLFVKKYLHEYQAHATLWPRIKFFAIYRVARYTLNTVLAIVIVYAATEVRAKIDPTIVYATVEKHVKDTSPTPILEKIFKCESGNSHYDRNGQVLINKTQDMGIAQINVPIWGKKAQELGYNLAVEADNIAFAFWLYENKGTEPWYPSKKCWQG